MALNKPAQKRGGIKKCHIKVPVILSLGTGFSARAVAEALGTYGATAYRHAAAFGQESLDGHFVACTGKLAQQQPQAIYTGANTRAAGHWTETQFEAAHHEKHVAK